MTPSEVRWKLKSIKALKEEIKVIELEIEELRTRAEGASSGFKTEFTPITGYVTSKIEDLVIKIIERQEKLKDKHQQLVDAEEEAENLIELLDDEYSDVRAILRARYINCMSTRQLANFFHFCKSSIFDYEKKGIKVIVERLNSGPKWTQKGGIIIV